MKNPTKVDTIGTLLSASAHNEEECVTSGTPSGRNGELVPKFRMKPSVPNRQQFARVCVISSQLAWAIS